MMQPLLSATLLLVLLFTGQSAQQPRHTHTHTTSPHSDPPHTTSSLTHTTSSHSNFTPHSSTPHSNSTHSNNQKHKIPFRLNAPHLPADLSVLSADVLHLPSCLHRWVDPTHVLAHPAVHPMLNLLNKHNESDSYVLLRNPGLRYFQHAMNSFYPYLSLKLWFHLEHQQSKNLICILGRGSESFWFRHDVWLDHFLLSAEPITGVSFLYREGKPAPPINTIYMENFFAFEVNKQRDLIYKGWNRDKTFIHKSDAFRISSIILKKDPCRFQATIATALKTPPVIKILNRRSSRRFLDIDNLLADLKGEYHHSIEVGYFENTEFQYQAEFMSSTDILVVAHGAAEGNASV
jgi:hypothetical protein